MLGNVWEWVQDWYAEDYYRHSPTVDPQGPEAGAERVLRGGRWGSDAQFVRAAYRLADDPGYRDADLGFRCSSSGSSK
jgi:formylglycine-generating enzyme required for sulfatase activity